MSEKKRILGVDYGAARTGLAASDENGVLAIGIRTVKAAGLHELARVISDAAAERGCSLIVIGLPVNMDGSEGEKCEKVRLLGSYVTEACGLPVEYFDERLTTVEAHRILNVTNTRGKARKERVDTLAAEIILQGYLDSGR